MKRRGPFILCLVVAAVARAGEWHTQDLLVCTDCHTMHNSSGGLPMRYDNAAEPAPKLLRHASSMSLCVHCHDGVILDAPDVISPVSYVADPPAGFFGTVGQPNPNGHDLASASTPPGGSAPLTLTCTTCHDHHGSPSYRNLRGDPSGQNQAAVTVAANQLVVANGANPAAVYTPSNVTYVSGTSAWCGQCHGAFHGRSSAEEGTASPWFRHPQDATLSTAPNVDFLAWSSPITNRVRVESPSGAPAPSNQDRVFCLSCHKAHGSGNKASLIFANGTSIRSTCQQCHNQ